MNILIIDPSASYRSIVREMLSKIDCQIIEAHCGQDAIHYLKTKTPAAICIAHELGDMDSFKFLKKVRLNPKLENTPTFLLTSHNTKEFKRAAYDAGFTEMFIKSDFPSLKRALNSIMLYTTLKISARILYIEDTQSTADYTRHIMENQGWKVVHVKSGEAAAEVLDKDKLGFDLVITDLVLEGQISGMGLINLIRQGQDKIRELPILAISGWNDLLRQVYVLKHGAGDFIAKPFQETDFLARAINLIMAKRDRDALIAAQNALAEKANLDSLTGVNNRHYLDEYGHQLVKHALSHNEAIALLLLDIDFFKDINDMMGHAAGDLVLKTVAQILKTTSLAQDIVVRYGGDEFIVLIKGVNHDHVLERAESIRQRVACSEPDGISVKCTIGLACHDKKVAAQLVTLLASFDPEEDIKIEFDTLFKAADQSLYSAKQAGRNRVCMNNLLERPQKDCCQ